MKVSYELVVSRENMEFMPESEIRKHPERYSEYLSFVKTVHLGKVVLEDGDQRFELMDEMWHIAVILCFGAMEPLLNEKSVEYRLMQTGQLILLEPQSGTIKITGISGNTAEFGKTALLKQLYECGRRYLTLLTDVLPHGGHEKSAAVYATYADAAESVLSAHGIL